MLVLLVSVAGSRRCYQNTCLCFLGRFTESWLTLGDVSPQHVGVHILKPSSHSLDLVVEGRYAMHGFCEWPMWYLWKCGTTPLFFFLRLSLAEFQQWLLNFRVVWKVGVFWLGVVVFWFSCLVFWFVFLLSFFSQKLFLCSEIPFMVSMV